ncbi:hypothetical protein Pcinc_031022 [Petrolisthes cinctipes]|uniref:peptidylprolyl isomerase n=1 Tax=Petrolisthes cinctipes TaxID=88211 RepID=A0AAE1K3L6_PETCI|nr:hypothetical protein Pcinc_031022 [Petrolisthes cinctipes]
MLTSCHSPHHSHTSRRIGAIRLCKGLAMAGHAPPAAEQLIRQKLTKARELKEKGNEHFKQQQVKKAIQSYHSGLMYVKGIDQDLNPNKILGKCQDAPSLPQDVKEEVTDMSAHLHNNLAACLLKQEPVRYERVVSCCEHVTELRPQNIKGWYRLGLAHYHLRDYDKASDALKKANTLAGGQDMAVKKLLLSVDQELKKENKKFSDMFKNSLLVKPT